MEAFKAPPAETILSTVQIFWASSGTHPTVTKLPWSWRWFYTKRAFRKSRTRQKRSLDQDKDLLKGSRKSKKRELLKAVFVMKLKDGGKRGSWANGTDAVKRLDFVCELCSTVGVDVFESHGSVFAELADPYCQKLL